MPAEERLSPEQPPLCSHCRFRRGRQSITYMWGRRGTSAPDWIPDEGEGWVENRARTLLGRTVLLHFPMSASILHAAPMYRPRNNAVVLDDLDRVLGRYPFVNCFIYDRACGILEDVASRRKALWKIRNYTTEKFHAARHRLACRTDPPSNPPLTRRLETLNASTADQTLSRFRGYTRSMNELRQARRKCLGPLYAKEHKELLSDGDAAHLNQYSHQGRSRDSAPYECDGLHAAPLAKTRRLS